MLPDLSMLMHQCAPNVGQVTMQAIIKTESGGNPYILADAGPANLPWSQRESMVRTLRPRSAQEAAQVATDLVARGHIVAIGLTQINSQNLQRFNLTIEQVLDPCTNIATGAKILTSFYASALKTLRTNDSQAALQAALSAYWSGSFVRGFAGGYVQKVIDNAGLAVELKVPSLADPRLQTLRTLRRPAAPGAGIVLATADPRSAPLEAPGFKAAYTAQQ